LDGDVEIIAVVAAIPSDFKILPSLFNPKAVKEEDINSKC